MKSYITTPIYYVNGAPHLGHAHTSTMADILKRNRKAIGYETKLTTGVDEHGQKNQEAAEASGLSSQAYLDGRSEEFRRVFDLMNVDYDYFVRTSRPEHQQRVAEIEQRLFDEGLIIKKQYHGLYCTGCEQFKKASDLNEDGRCPDHPNIELIELDETNYFLRIEPYRERLLQHIEDNPGFVDPPMYRTELKQMLAEPLDDLSISRPKRRVSLGVELPFDSEYVTYVWFDALLNYLTNIAWPDPGYEDWWETAEHLIGKDILKTHGVYWPLMLMGIGVNPPARLSVHAHWTGAGGMKMSKTAGNAVDPVEVVESLGADALRYYLARNMRAESDSQISVELVQQTYNGELGNKIGNLFSRAAKFAGSRFGDEVPAPGPFDGADEALRNAMLAAAEPFGRRIEMAEIYKVMDGIVNVVGDMNSYFADSAPWDLIKDPATEERCRTVVYVALDGMRLVFEALRQVIPESADKALAMLNSAVDESAVWTPALDRLAPGTHIEEIETLFPRFQG